MIVIFNNLSISSEKVIISIMKVELSRSHKKEQFAVTDFLSVSKKKKKRNYKAYEL